jgi:hypothetical protein
VKYFKKSFWGFKKQAKGIISAPTTFGLLATGKSAFKDTSVEINPNPQDPKITSHLMMICSQPIKANPYLTLLKETFYFFSKN